MAYFACSITPPPKGSIARSKSVPSFVTSSYVTSRVQAKITFDITMNDIRQFEVYPECNNTRTVSEYLHQTENSMLVMFPARENLERSVTRYNKSTEDLKDISKRMRHKSCI